MDLELVGISFLISSRIPEIPYPFLGRPWCNTCHYRPLPENMASVSYKPAAKHFEAKVKISPLPPGHVMGKGIQDARYAWRNKLHPFEGCLYLLNVVDNLWTSRWSQLSLGNFRGVSLLSCNMQYFCLDSYYRSPYGGIQNQIPRMVVHLFSKWENPRIHLPTVLS